MSNKLNGKLVVAISSRALFDLDASNSIFEQQGIDAYLQYQIENENNILEGGVLLKAKYIGGGIGFLIEKKLYDYMRSKQNITLIAGIWEENIPSIKLVQKNGMRFVKKINKSYNNKTIVVDLYVDFINSHSSLVPDDKYFTIVKLSKFY